MSLALEGSELAWVLGGVHGELIVLTMLDQTRVDHLGHEVGGNLARLVLLLQVHDLLLEVVDHG